MTIRPPGLHPYRRNRRTVGPRSIAGLKGWWPIAGPFYQDAAMTMPATYGDPVGGREDISGQASHLLQATTAKKPTLDATGPGVRYDMVDDLLKTTYNLSMASRWAIMMSVWSKDDSDKFTLRDTGVTNLNAAGEKALNVPEGANFQRVMPANWDPDDWSVQMFAPADWASTDGFSHPWGAIYADANNYVEWGKNPAGDLYCTVVAAGTTKTATLTLAIAAGDTPFFGARLNSGTLTVYADTNSDTVLETATAVGVPASTGASWTLHAGKDQAGTAWLEGAVNLLITNDGSSADPITDRFNGGAGMALGGDMGWLAQVSGNGSRHGENLVLHVGGNSDGSAVQIDTAQGATDLLAGTATGRYDFSSDDIDFGDDAALDGAAEASFLFEFEVDSLAADGVIYGRWWNGTHNRKQIAFALRTGGTIRGLIATDLVGGQANGDFGSFVAGGRYLVWVRYDGAGATDADKFKASVATYNAATRQYGAFAAQTVTFTGSAMPAAFTTPASATSWRAGKYASGDIPFDGKIDDIRRAATALAIADLDAQVVNEAEPYLWDHWYPMDGDANDAIGSINGTVTGATQVADGRHHLGRMERYVKSGQYYFDGVDDYIDFGAFTATDGQAEMTVWGVFTVGKAAEQSILCHWKEATAAARGWQVETNGSPRVRFRVATDGVGGVESYLHSQTLTLGTKYAFFVRFKGDEAVDADKVQIGVAAHDAATGTYGAWTTERLGDAATPATLRTPSAANLFAGATSDDMVHLLGLIDSLRLNVDTALSVATLEATTVYSRTDANWDHAWEFDVGATDQIGAQNGTVTGAIQWYDGRQPEGWVGGGSNLELDRANDYATVGTWGLRIKEGAGAISFQPSPERTVNAGEWFVFLGDGRRLSDSADIRTNDVAQFGALTKSDLPLQPTMEAVGLAVRVLASGAGSFGVNTGAGGEGYADNLRAIELATLSPTVATLGVPSRVIASFSKDGAQQPYVYTALATDEKLEIGFREDSGTRTEASSTGSVSTGVHSLIVEFDGADLVAYVDTLEVARVTVTGTLTGLDILTLGALKQFVEGNSFDERIGECWLHAGPDFPGTTATDRQRLHNYLADRTAGLAVV